ncbi:MAG: VOC family protein [Armatimonadetes bacterium]|nr:VOC family protein [Armatimonadota bacterium]MBS1726485.1 VOC family protein [Armatimonadota bacterium]
MVTRFSHAPIFVKDQDSAYDFYVNKLGFEVRTDAMMGEFRWLTVGPKTQPDFEIILMPIRSPMAQEGSAELLEKLQEIGTLGAGVFEVDDCRATYEELKAKGVQFRGEPEEQFYGIEAIMVDDSGNWFSMTQHKPH